LTGGQRLKIVALEIVRDQVIEAVFTLFRRKRLHQGMTTGVGHVSRDLSPQGAMANGLEPSLEGIEDLFVVEVGKLLAKALEVTEGVLIDKA
jgi:hypothetical protein